MQVSDGLGGTSTQVVQVTVTGTNDAPVIDVAGSDITGSIIETGVIARVASAGPSGGLSHDFDLSSVQGQIDGLSVDAGAVEFANVYDAVLDVVGSDAAAIAVLWQYLDGEYSPTAGDDAPINEAFVRLGAHYADLLAQGKVTPLTDVIAKYTADTNGSGAPDRMQSLHDNLLGNLKGSVLSGRFDALLTELRGIVDGLDGTIDPANDALLNRPAFSGHEDGTTGTYDTGESYDAANDVVARVTGTIVADDVDNGAVLEFIGDATGTYGEFTIDPVTGEWTYVLDQAATDFLAQGETRTETFTVTVSDEHTATDTVEVEITITGTNDAPEITVEAGDSASARLTETNSALTSQGTLTVSDVDVSDVVAVSSVTVAATGASIQNYVTLSELAGFFTVTPTPIIDDSSTSGQLAWEFTSGDSTFDFLRAGWQTFITYTITVSDGNGGVDTQTVQIRVTGTNDAPVITTTSGAAVEQTINEDATNPIVGGDLNATDVDQGSVQNWSVVGNPVGTYGTFAINSATGEWTYTLDSVAAQELAANESQIETVTMQVSDGLGGTSTQVVQVTVTGTNDAPHALALVGSEIPADNTAGFRVGELTVSDVDDDSGFTFTISEPGFTVVTETVGGVEHYYLETTAPITDLPASMGITVSDGDGGSYTANFAVTLPVELFAPDQTTLIGSYSTIQGALDGAVDDGRPDMLIKVGAGNYAEDLTIETPVIIEADDGATLAPVSGTAITIAAGVDGDVTIDNLDLQGNAATARGIDVEEGANLGTLTFTNGSISGFSYAGIYASDTGTPVATPTMANIVVTGAEFSNNGFGGGNGAGHIKLFGYSGNATLDDLEIAGTSDVGNVAMRPDNAIEITVFIQSEASAGQVDPNAPNIGLISLNDIVVTGEFHKNPVAFFNFGEVDGLSVTNLDLSGAESDWGPLFNIDGVADGVINASGFTIKLPEGSDIHTEIQGDKPGQDPVDQTITGTDGNDRIIGKGGNDTLRGGDGDDQLYGADKPGGSAEGDMGNDRLEGGAGNDALIGGGGIDTAVYNGALSALDFTTIADADPTAGDLPGWQIDARGAGFVVSEGVDTLTGVQIVEGTDPDGAGGASGRFLLVGNGGFATIQDAVDAAASGDTILIAEGSFDLTSAGATTPGQLVIDKDLTFIGQGMGTSTIQAVADTGASGDARGMFLVEAGVTLNLSNLSVDGNGHSIYQGFRHQGSGTFDKVGFTDIQYGSSGPQYAGTAIAVFNGGAGQNVDVLNSQFTDIGRVGVAYFGADVSGNFEGNSYTGKGAGDHLDYAVEISAGADIALVSNTITQNLGVASSDGSISAGVLVTTFFGAGTETSVEGNTFTDNTYGIVVGFDGADTSTVEFSTGNSFTGGTGGVAINGNAVVTDIDLIGGAGATVNWNGGANVNLISGADLADTLRGGAGDDIINAGGGDDTIIWNVGDGSDIVDGSTVAAAAADTDTFIANGSVADEKFFVETVADYNARLGVDAVVLDAATEIVVSRSTDDGVTSEIVSQLANIDEIVVNGGGGTDSFVVSGDYAGTDLDPSTITIVGSDGDDTIDLSDFADTGHRVVFQPMGGNDTVTSARAQDLIDVTGREVAGVVSNGDGSYTLTLDDNSTVTFTGTPTFVENGDTPSETLVNLPAATAADAYEVAEDGVLSVDAATGVLANDRDFEGDDLTVALATGPAHGALTLNADGSFDYTPDADYNGADSFTYTVFDGTSTTAPVTVDLTVTPVNDAPVILTPVDLPDGGFETPNISGYVYNSAVPVGPWTFTGRAGLSDNGTAFTNGNPAAPEGAQVAFLQHSGGTQGLISRSFDAQSGSYVLSFDAARRGNTDDHPQFQVVVDGVVQATIQTPDTTYTRHDVTVQLASDGAHTLELISLRGADVDETTFLDNFSLLGADGTPLALTVAENEVGALLGSFDVSDIDTATGLTFRVLDASDQVDARFEVVAASGTNAGEPGTYELRLKAGVSLDFEQASSIALTVEVDDHGLVNNLTTVPVRVTVTDVNEAPIIVSLSDTVNLSSSSAAAGANGTYVGSGVAAVDGQAGTNGLDALALYENAVLAGTTGNDHTTLLASAIGQNGGAGGLGGNGGNTGLSTSRTGSGAIDDPYVTVTSYSYTATDGADGGNGGSGGMATAELSGNTVSGAEGEDVLRLNVDARGGLGGAGGAAGNAGFHGNTGTISVREDYDYFDYNNNSYSPTWYRYTYTNAGQATDSGSAGDGADSGQAIGTVVDNTMNGGSGNDVLSIEATVQTRNGGNGGLGRTTRGGLNNNASPGASGDGGNAGHAAATITGNGLAGGEGIDILEILATVSSGAGGNGAGNSLSAIVHYPNTVNGTSGVYGNGWYDSIYYYGDAGSGGDGGNGGNASVVIDDNVFAGDAGNDVLRIAVELTAGAAGVGGLPNAGSSVVYTYASYVAGETGSPGSAGENGVENLNITNNELLGGSGDDKIEISTGSVAPGGVFDVSGNIFDGGEDFDILDLSGLDRAIDIDLGEGTLMVGTGSNTVTSIEKVIGTSYADTMTGSDGDDILNGGEGYDILTGGAGNDTFVFDLDALADAVDNIQDLIADYEIGGDMVDLSELLGSDVDQDNVGDYVKLDDTGTILQVDVDGNGDSFVDLARFGSAQNTLKILVDDGTDTPVII